MIAKLPASKNGVAAFYAKNRKAWRKWLQTNHATSESVWLIIFKKETKIPSVYYPEAVDEALCFGWIDSVANKGNDKMYYQYFAKRKPKSNWSKVNKEKVERLLAEGLMHTSGLAMVELAKKSGTWDALNKVEALEIPGDLKKAFAKNKTAFKNFEAFPPSSRRGILEWILNAKKEETRTKRIQETVDLAAKGIKANHARQ